MMNVHEMFRPVRDPAGDDSSLPETSMNLLRRFLHDESGATAIEYGLIAALVAVVLITALTTLGTSLTNVFGDISDALGDAGTGGTGGTGG
jgi:pilus assembly protein Flp/PilA